MVGTLQPAPNFNAEVDCEALNDAMCGSGTDEKALIDVLCRRSAEQRVEIVKMYKTCFGKDLISQIKSETSGNFRTTLLALCQSTPHFLARMCNKAVKGAGTSEGALINIIVGSTNKEIEEVKAAYKFLYKKDLEHAVASDTSGCFKRVLVSLIQGNRSEDTKVNFDKAVEDAKALFKAGKDKIGTDESTFNRILVTRSPRHLKLVFTEYKNIAGEDIETSIKSEMSGDVEDAFLALAKLIKDPEMYFAEQLYKSMKGLGTNDDKLIRIMVWRSEIDMVEIKEEFKAIAKGKTLESFIKGDCGGDYKDAMLALCA